MSSFRVSLVTIAMLVLLAALGGAGTLSHDLPASDGPQSVSGTVTVGPLFRSATFDDARLSGRPWLSGGDGPESTPTLEIVNSNGSWAGPIRGYVTLDPWTRHCHAELAGSGSYRGLSALLHITGPQEGRWEVEGVIQPSAARNATER